MELINLGARLQMLESETQLSRGRLIRLYKELRGSPPPKRDAAIFDRLVYDLGAKYSCLHVLQRLAILLKTGLCSGVDAVIKAYRLYLEQCPQPPEGPLLALTRAWTLVRFVESGLLELSSCNCCGGNFITHAHQPVGSFACSLCQPPSRAVKRRKLSRDAADIIPQLLDEQIEQAV